MSSLPRPPGLRFRGLTFDSVANVHATSLSLGNSYALAKRQNSILCVSAQFLKTTWVTKAGCGQGDLKIDVRLDVRFPFEGARITIGRQKLFARHLA